MTSQKLLSLKSPKLHSLPDSMGNQLSRVSSKISKFPTEIPNTCGHVKMEALNFLNAFLAQSRGSRSQRRPEIPFFSCFCDLLGPKLIPVTTKTATDVEHSITCINAMANLFIMIFISLSKGLEYAENGQD